MPGRGGITPGRGGTAPGRGGVGAGAAGRAAGVVTGAAGLAVCLGAAFAGDAGALGVVVGVCVVVRRAG